MKDQDRAEWRMMRREAQIRRVRDAQDRWQLRQDMKDLGFGPAEIRAINDLVKTGEWSMDDADKHIVSRLILVEEPV